MGYKKKRLSFCFVGIIVCAPLIAENALSSEPMSWLDNGQIKLGVDLTLGGAITWLADAKTGENLINSFDWGRQVQMAFYSGPRPYIPEGKRIKDAWVGLGWNPIQSGDYFGNRSKVIEHRNDGKTISVKCIPMIWPLDNVPGECVFESVITLDGRAARITNRLINRRPDQTWYGCYDQELPAVYTNAPYHKLMTYAGDKPFTGDAAVEIPKKQVQPGEFPWSQYIATESWAALVNDNNYGLGVWNEGVYSFLGGFHGKPGKGGTKDSATGYIAPVKQEILDHNIEYQFSYALIIGTLDNIRSYVYAHSAKNTPPQFTFAKDRQSWTYRNAKDAGWPIQGCLDIRADDPNAELLSPNTFWQAEPNQTLTLVAAAKNKNAAPARSVCIFWKTDKNNAFTPEQSIQLELPADGRFHSTSFPLGKAKGYDGNITGLKLTPFIDCRPGDAIQIRQIAVQVLSGR
jgi:hypothetical protein